jgi:hypothetical protein
MNKSVLLCLIPIVVAVIAITMLYSMAVGDYLSAGDFVTVDLLNSFNNGGDTGSIAGRWNTEARIFNVKGKPVIYDTVSRSGISVVIQRWASITGISVEAMAKSNETN